MFAIATTSVIGTNQLLNIDTVLLLLIFSVLFLDLIRRIFSFHK